LPSFPQASANSGHNESKFPLGGSISGMNDQSDLDGLDGDGIETILPVEESVNLDLSMIHQLE
jgi:hypothetical protein